MLPFESRCARLALLLHSPLRTPTALRRTPIALPLCSPIALPHCTSTALPLHPCGTRVALCNSLVALYCCTLSLHSLVAISFRSRYTLLLHSRCALSLHSRCTLSLHTLVAHSLRSRCTLLALSRWALSLQHSRCTLSLHSLVALSRCSHVATGVQWECSANATGVQ